MKEMTTEMAALLKSKNMIGENRPTAEIVIGGNTSSNFRMVSENEGIPLKRTMGYKTGPNDYFSIKRSTNFVPTNDGRFLACFVKDDGLLYCGYSPDESFFDESYNIDKDSILQYTSITNPNETGLDAQIIPRKSNSNPYDYPMSLFKRDDGKILLFLNDVSESINFNSFCNCLISESGNGDDFQYYSTVYKFDVSNGIGHIDWENIISKCMEVNTPTGKRLILTLGTQYNYYSEAILVNYSIYTSDDNGLNWVFRFKQGAGMAFTLLHTLGQLAQIPSGEIYFEVSWSSASHYLVKSIDYGTTWTVANNRWGDGWNVPNNEGVIIRVKSLTASLYYHEQSDTLYRYSGWVQTHGVHIMPNPTPEKIENKDEWRPATALNNIENRNFVSHHGVIIDEMPSGNIAIMIRGNVAGILGWNITIDKIQPKSISISRNKGMAGNVQIEFDNKSGILAPDGEMNKHLFWPNKKLEVFQGYGAELIKTFTGSIDNINMSTFPQNISISARDNTKVLLDHYAKQSSGDYVLTYNNNKIGDIWKNLITLAGLQFDKVEETGLTIKRKIFSWESYADCISWLDEISGFHTYCDEEGKMNFVRDGRPVDAQVSYEFTEGVDIINLGYEIDDSSLYYKVIVFGATEEVRDEDDKVVTESEVIKFEKEFPSKNYWNIPQGKVLKIDASEANTLTDCEIIADKAIYLMETRARKVNFETIGIPHLQIGDFIQVTETSTTISEIYRITDLSSNQSDGNYKMNIICHHHSAPEGDE